MEFDNERKLDDFILWSKHETNIKWIKNTKVTTYVNEIKGWCFSKKIYIIQWNHLESFTMKPFISF